MMGPPADRMVSRGIALRQPTVRLVASATDDVGVKWVKFYVNGKFASSSEGPNYIFDYAVRSGGKRTVIVAKASDNAGNIGTSNRISL